MLKRYMHNRERAHWMRDDNRIVHPFGWGTEFVVPNANGDDPRMVLIGIQVHSALFLEVNKPQPLVLFEIAKGWATGTMPDIGTMHEVNAK